VCVCVCAHVCAQTHTHTEEGSNQILLFLFKSSEDTNSAVITNHVFNIAGILHRI
jgi:hypothetical protein